METKTKNENEVIARLAKAGYVWTPSKLIPGGVAKNPDGWKVAIDFQTNGWCHYKGRYDTTTEAKGFDKLAQFLGK